MPQGISDGVEQVDDVGGLLGAVQPTLIKPHEASDPAKPRTPMTYGCSACGACSPSI